MQAENKRNAIISSTIIGATTLLIVSAVVITSQSDNTKPSLNKTTKITATKPNNDSSGTSSAYKDGTYSATGNYSSPDGAQQIGITLTVSDDTVTSTSAQNKASGRDSSQYQDIFISNYKDSVVGKKINDIELDQVSGSSLTPIGFNDAVSKIQDQAKA